MFFVVLNSLFTDDMLCLVYELIQSLYPKCYKPSEQTWQPDPFLLSCSMLAVGQDDLRGLFLP